MHGYVLHYMELCIYVYGAVYILLASRDLRPLCHNQR